MSSVALDRQQAIERMATELNYTYINKSENKPVRFNSNETPT
jgi:hypothetical protein